LYTCFRRPRAPFAIGRQAASQAPGHVQKLFIESPSLVESWSAVERLSWQEKQSACAPGRQRSAPHASELTSVCQETDEMQKGTRIVIEP
jgi:hypothetical protein